MWQLGTASLGFVFRAPLHIHLRYNSYDYTYYKNKYSVYHVISLIQINAIVGTFSFKSDTPVYVSTPKSICTFMPHNFQ